MDTIYKKEINNKTDSTTQNNISSYKLNNNSKNNENQNREPIYILTLELDEGKPEKIKIYSDSDSTKLAADFCKEHNLDYNGLDYLRQKINNIIKEKTNFIPNDFSSNSNYNTTANDQMSLNIKNQKINNIKKNPNSCHGNNLTSPKILYNSFSSNFNGNSSNKEKISKKINCRLSSSNKKFNHKCKARINNINITNNFEDNTQNNCAKMKHNNSHQKSCHFGYRLENQESEMETITSNNNNINNSNKKNYGSTYKKNNDKNRIYFSNYGEYLYERNKQLQIEKEKELSNLNKQIDSRANKKFSFNNNYSNCTHKILQEYDQKYTFHPNINDKYRTDLSFQQRQNFFVNLYKQRNQLLKNFYSNPKVDADGTILFQPKLVTKYQIKKEEANKNNNTINAINIFDKNYLYYEKYNNNKEKLIKKYNNENTNKPIFYSKFQTDKIINESNIKAFTNLFNDLDSDQDNIITGTHICLTKIPKFVLKIIEPLLNELKEDHQSLNKEEFIKVMNKLFEEISSVERREIIRYYKKQMKRSYSVNICHVINNNINVKNTNYEKIAVTPVINNNTNKLAYKHDQKIKKMFSEYLIKNQKKNKRY